LTLFPEQQDWSSLVPIKPIAVDPLRRGYYRCAVIDPPWNETGGGRIKRGADRHYQLLKTPAIIALLREEIAPQLHPDCHLWLWVTNNYLRDGFRVIDELGFTYKTNMVWVKNRIGLGQYLRGQHELCLFSVRGQAMMPPVRNVPSVLTCAKGKHSEKPAESYERIRRVSPPPYLEVFTREQHAGFHAWGDEVRTTLFS